MEVGFSLGGCDLGVRLSTFSCEWCRGRGRYTFSVIVFFEERVWGSAE